MSAVAEAREPSARYLEALHPPLLRQFDLLASAQGGVARLRQLILELAVQGKLVRQDSHDEPAAGLLARARGVRGQLVATGKLRRSAVVPPIGEEEQVRELPPGWSWARIGDVGQVVGGGTPKSDVADYWAEAGVPWLTPADLYDYRHKRISRGRRDISAEGLASSSAQLLPPGTVLFSSRAPIGYVAIAGLALATNQGFKSCVPFVDGLSDYLFCHLKQLAPRIDESASGTTFKEISGADFAAVVLSLPPIAEQARIVARVDELMLLCDALETQGRLEAEQHARLLGALLGTLTESATREQLAANWQRVAEHFDLLLDRPETVDALEQTILQLAVRGLLVPQDPVEEPAADLLHRIRAHREQQVKAGLAKRDKLQPKVAKEDFPFELPLGWEWIRFDELIEPSKPISYGVLVPGPEVTGGVPFVRIADLSLTDPPQKPEKSISAEVDAQYLRTRLEGGEILMGVVGSIGKLGVAPASWAGANIARAICRVVPVGLVSREFVLLLLESGFMQSNFSGDTRTLAQPTLNVGLIRSSPTPLPPLAEQGRIVSRVAELRRLCADLRQRLVASAATQTHLADALVEQALA
ncbi:MAG: restriction endonuclease subunit S [Rubrivivax sp.]|nr:restriction endonuclease subunit S [Rubrivivax sp.]